MNGETLTKKTELNHNKLIFDAKDRGTFKLAAWRRENNSDLCFVSMGVDGKPLAITL